MATNEQAIAFIEKIAPMCINQWRAGNKVLPSVAIAQACCECAYGTASRMMKSNALYGIKATKSWKGKVYSATTKECYDGINYVTVNGALFRAYDTIEESVADYYKLITTLGLYKKAVGEMDYVKCIQAIKDGGYATSPTYVNTICSIIKTYGLTKYDVCEPQEEHKCVEEEHIAIDVLRGKWGVGEERKRRLTEAGYSYAKIQGIVNEIVALAKK